LALKQELKDLWLLRRNEVVPALRAAAAEGDRSENAEYIYRKKQLGEIDRRIRYLSKRLDVVEVVRHRPPRQDRVFFGARVSLEDDEGNRLYYRIVGADETDAGMGWISVDSPVARALLGKEVDDSIKVELPEGQVELSLLEIAYD
jgi:transcription elongation factor GreB